jgi:hypothetical protein
MRDLDRRVVVLEQRAPAPELRAYLHRLAPADRLAVRRIEALLAEDGRGLAVIDLEERGMIERMRDELLEEVERHAAA